MQIADAQADLRRAYVDGGPGVAISGCIWLAAYIVQLQQGGEQAFVYLFIGGMFIFPLALLVDRVILRRAKEHPNNPGGMLVLESTIAMIAGLIAAWLFLPYQPDYVMPLAAIMVGTHYFAFKTAYGDKRFWALAALVTAIGAAGLYGLFPRNADVTVWVALVELVFGSVVTMQALRRA